jgi:hypothetical protein
MAEPFPPRILITDTGPLITLAVSESLDYLLIPGIPVIIPDAVFYEATSDINRLGAADIVDWSHEHVHQVHIVPTTIFAAHQAALENGLPPIGDVGERAAIEVGRNTTWMTEGESCLLLSEDDRVLRGGFIIGDDAGRIEIISTYDFLTVLEEKRRINSVDAVYQRANDGGRLASIKQTRKENHERAKAALEAVMTTNGPKS